MVTGHRVDPESVAGIRDLMLRIDGSHAPTAESVAELGALCDRALCDRALCDRAQDRDTNRFVILRVSGVPGPGWSNNLPVGLVSKWERGLRRLERLPVLTIAVADDDCGGPALDALLAADYRIMPAGARLVMPVVAGATWPGMALYRLARQAAGAALARRTVLFGTPIGATEAQAMGVIDDTAANAALAVEKAMEVTGAAPGAELAIRRQLMLEAMTTTFEDALGAHLAACDRVLRSVSTGAA
jgi:isomerase DpgB